MEAFTGTTALVRFALRRDRVRLLVWIGGITALVLVSAASIEGLYDTAAERQTYAELIQANAAMIVQSGPGFGLDDPSKGAILVNETMGWTVVAVGLMSTFLVARHTRSEEETGRAELVRAAAVGRDAAPLATLAVVGGANAAVGLVCALGLVAFGLPTAGAVAFGVAVGAAGGVFTGVALVAAQVAATARATVGLGTAAVVLSFILRAVGDVGDGRLSWLSPIGWAHRVRPFADERWAVAALAVLVGAALVLAANAVATRRDFGAGLLTERAGRERATAGLGTPYGLAWRLQRGSLLGWAIGLFVLGFFYGVVGDEAEELLADNPDLRDFFAQIEGASLTDMFLATALLMMALLVCGFAVASVLRLRGEETAGRAEPVLATATSRWAWAAGHLSVAVLGSALVVAIAGVGVGAGYALATGDPADVARLTGAALVNVPAVLVVVGLAVALVGLVPRAAGAAWAALAVVVVVGILGDLLRLPDWVRVVSPFEHVPGLPAAQLALVPLVVLVLVAGALGAAGLVGLRRRDVA
jgi:ABC-2 type transport system permease protein